MKHPAINREIPQRGTAVDNTRFSARHGRSNRSLPSTQLPVRTVCSLVMNAQIGTPGHG